jgi:hypothetical protein
LVHVPTDPASAHDWQVPAHAVAQQTPWAQTFDSHSPAAAHAAPSGFVVQLPPMQVNGATQSLLAVHVVRQAPAPQAYGLHIDVVAAWQAPVPLHARALVSVEPVHIALPHDVPSAYSRQPPVPLHDPSVPQVDMSLVAHWFNGS